MCELLAVSSFQPSRLSFPLKTMTAYSSNDHRLLDGWGVAYYQGKDVILFRETVAACNSELGHCLERQGPAATLAICHLRHANQGEISLANTGPFVRELAGRMHVFAHNGNLKGIEKVVRLAPGSYQTIGETDSEYAFCTLLEHLKALWQKNDGVPPLIDRITVIARFAHNIRKLGPANFLYADGDALFAYGDRRRIDS
jgi:predicted glutamine amidotransferase